jgi:hypothetical protein
VLPRSKVDLYAAIRRDSRAGLSSLALKRKFGVGFRTVEKALTWVWPGPARARARARARAEQRAATG